MMDAEDDEFGSLNAQLFRAVYNEDAVLCLALIEARADVNTHPQEEHWVPAREDYDEDDSDAELPEDRGGYTCLINAAYQVDYATVKVLLEAKADVDLRNNQGSSALRQTVEALWEKRASEAECARVATLLIEHKADLEFVGDEETALMSATWCRSVRFVDLLLKARANPNTANESGVTALHHVEDAQTCELLLAAKASVHARTSIRGNTPLFHAAVFGLSHLCTLLLNANSDVTAKNETGHTALEAALLRERPDAVAAIRQWVKDRDAARAFARGMRHAYNTRKTSSWADSKLFDINLVDEITAFVTAAYKSCSINSTQNPRCAQCSLLVGRPLRQCAACRSVCYCSKQCQMTHWTVGKHRTTCPAYKQLRKYGMI
jgi:hypothetical protein